MEFLHPKCGGWVGACAMKAQDCEFFTHPPTSKISQSSPDGKMDVKCRQIKNGKRNHMGRATQIPQSGRTVPSIPLFCEGKNMRQVDHGRLCIRQLSFVCSLMFLILAVMFFKQTFWRRRILGYANMNTEFLCCIYVLRM